MLNNNKKIIIIIPTNGFGGSEYVLEMVAQRLASSNMATIVYFYASDPQIPRFEENRVIISKKSKFMGYLKFVPYIIRQSNSDIVFSSQLYINFFLGILRKLKILRTKVLIFRESTMIFRRFKGLKLYTFKLLYRAGYNFSDLIVCSTKDMRSDLLKNIPNANTWSIRVLQNPVDIEMLNRSSIENIYDYKYNKGKFIVAAGRLIKEKGFNFLVEAFNQIKEKYPDLKLLILGEGKEEKSLQRQIEISDLNKKVILFGYVNNPIPFFKMAKICVVSSIIEGFPNVLLQMMSQNERVVSTTCAGEIDEIKGLFLCPPGDSNALANKMDEALQIENVFNNRNIFDLYLKKNSINNYVNTLLSFSTTLSNE